MNDSNEKEGRAGIGAYLRQPVPGSARLHKNLKKSVPGLIEIGMTHSGYVRLDKIGLIPIRDEEKSGPLGPLECRPLVLNSGMANF